MSRGMTAFKYINGIFCVGRVIFNLFYIMSVDTNLMKLLRSAYSLKLKNLSLVTTVKLG